MNDRNAWFGAVLATTLMTVGAVVAALGGGHGGLPLVVTALVLIGYAFPYSALTFGPAADSLKDGFEDRWRNVALGGVFLFALHLVYAVGTQTFSLSAAGRLFGFIAAPIALAFAARNRARPSWLDLLAVACVWLPFDTGHLKGIWAWPAGDGAYILNTVLAIDLAALVFIGARGIRDVKLRFHLSGADALFALGMLLAFMAVAIPFGLATDFVQFNPRLGDAAKLIGTPLGIFFFIAVPEELLFRGLVQNILEKRLRRPNLALGLTAVFFGLTHFNNTPSPDWRYLLLASIAGVVYGLTYRKTKSLLAPALVHAAVDTIWVLFLMNPAVHGGVR